MFAPPLPPSVDNPPFYMAILSFYLFSKAPAFGKIFW